MTDPAQAPETGLPAEAPAKAGAADEVAGVFGEAAAAIGEALDFLTVCQTGMERMRRINHELRLGLLRSRDEIKRLRREIAAAREAMEEGGANGANTPDRPDRRAAPTSDDGTATEDREIIEE